MDCLHKPIFPISFSQQPGLLVCATKMNFSAKQMVSAFRRSGSVMATQTASMDLMSTMAVPPRPALHLISSVTMETASTESGSVMGIMTAGTWAMRRTAPRRPFSVPVGNGNAPVIASVWIWVQYVMATLTAPVGQMSPHFAVSFLTTVYCHKFILSSGRLYIIIVTVTM